MNNVLSTQLGRCVAVAAAASLLAPGSQGATVTITAGVGAGTVVFDSGGFETLPYVVGDTPATSDAAVGTWVLGSTADEGIKTLTGASTVNENGAAEAGPTGAYGGDNYLKVDRSLASATANTIISASFTQDITLADSSFEINYAYWGGAGSYSFLGVGSDGMGRVASGSEDEMNLQVAFDARNTVALNPLGNTDPNLGTFETGEWIEITYTWDHLAETNTITVGGNSYLIAKPTDSVNTVAGEFVFGLGLNEPSVFYDAVPEPGSLALTALGGLMLLRRKKSA